MGGLDKGLLDLSGKPLIELILHAVARQCDAIIINANRHIEQYGRYGYPVLNDSLGDFQGPLAGFLISMQNATTPYIVTMPCDAPVITAVF